MISKNSTSASYLPDISWNFFFVIIMEELEKFNKKHSFPNFVDVAKWQKIKSGRFIHVYSFIFRKPYSHAGDLLLHNAFLFCLNISKIAENQ